MLKKNNLYICKPLLKLIQTLDFKQGENNVKDKMKVIRLAVLFFALSCAAEAQDTLAIDNAKLIRVGDSVQLTMRIDMKGNQVGKHEIVLIEPSIEAPVGETVKLPSVGIYGQYPYYYYIRSGHNWLQRDGDMMLRAKKVQEPVEYATTLPYETWMDTAKVNITVSSNEYCDGQTMLSGYTVFSAVPHIHKIEPVVETTAKSVTGRVKIDYVVNITEINPRYHDNTRELRKIGQSIDSVRSDTANTITSITVKGWASPEGPYDNNVRLAKGRSQSLTSHIADTYNIPREMMRVDYEPEEWAGLRDSVSSSSLTHKDEIIAIIDDHTLDFDLDEKLRIIKRKYPKDYAYILRNYMPYLRHSDYTINYNRRVVHVNEGLADTTWTLPIDEALQPPTAARLKPFRPVLALKTNLLFDAVMAPNFEIEVPFGRYRQWSIMVEDWFPWWLFNRNSKQGSNPYRLMGVPYYSNKAKGYQDAYEVWLIGVELRRWFSKCWGDQPLMTGHFVGAYVASGKYDIEVKRIGDQGEFVSAGLTWGYSWLLGNRWNLEFSVSAGAVWGPQRHYHGEYDDTHLIWKENRKFFYAGPTKLKLSISWLLGDTLKRKLRKEARHE